MSIANGENHDASGVIDSGVALSVYTLISAAAAKMSSATTCASVSTFWSRAESSVPMTQIAVMTTITAHASAVTAIRESAALSAPIST